MVRVPDGTRGGASCEAFSPGGDVVDRGPCAGSARLTGTCYWYVSARESKCHTFDGEDGEESIKTAHAGVALERG